MSAEIKYNKAMREEMNRAVDHELERHRQPSEWDQILHIILAEFENELDHYVITIRGKEIISRRHQFVNQFQITLGELRKMQ